MRILKALGFSLPLAFLGLFFFYPLSRILLLGLAPEERLDLAPWQRLLTESYYRRVLWFTIWQAGASTALTLLIGLPAAHVFARYRFPGKDLLRALTTIPFVMPSLVVAAAFTALLGPRGRLNLLLMDLLNLEGPPIQLQHTIWMILLAHAFYNCTVIIRIVGGFWANLDARVEEAAAVLGANRWQVFRQVTLPLLLPALAAASLLVFLFCFTSFGVILILGGPRFATLEVEIYRQTAHLFNLPLAAALSLSQMVITFLIMSLYTQIQTRSAVPLNFRPRQRTERPLAGWRARLWAGGVLSFVFLALLAPLLALVERSFTLGGEWSLAYYQELFVEHRGGIFYVPPALAIRNSLLFALTTVGLALLLGTISAYLLSRRRSRLSGLLDPIFMLPLGTSAVTLGFGFILALGQPPLNLRTSPLLIPLAHTLVAFPFVVRSLLPVLRGLNPHLREAAAVLGAAPLRVVREIDLPIVARALMVGAIFAFTVSMGEFGATILIARPEMPTMPVAIFRFLGRPGAINYGQALAMSALLMFVCAVGMLIIERFRFRDVGEF